MRNEMLQDWNDGLLDGKMALNYNGDEVSPIYIVAWEQGFNIFLLNQAA